jgi:hypothetical protein
MEMWSTILLALGGNAAVVAVLGWLAKSFVEGQLQKELVKFKAELSAETESAIEQLKHQLHLSATEHQIRFSQLHETRGEVIAELYALLVEAYWATSSFVSPMDWAGEPDKKEKYGIVMNKNAEFYRYFGNPPGNQPGLEVEFSTLAKGSSTCANPDTATARSWRF